MKKLKLVPSALLQIHSTVVRECPLYPLRSLFRSRPLSLLVSGSVGPAGRTFKGHHHRFGAFDGQLHSSVTSTGDFKLLPSVFDEPAIRVIPALPGPLDPLVSAGSIPSQASDLDTINPRRHLEVDSLRGPRIRRGRIPLVVVDNNVARELSSLVNTVGGHVPREALDRIDLDLGMMAHDVGGEYLAVEGGAHIGITAVTRDRDPASIPERSPLDEVIAGNVRGHAHEEMVYEPQGRAKDSLNVAHIKVVRIAICLAKNKRQGRMVGAAELDGL